MATESNPDPRSQPDSAEQIFFEFLRAREAGGGDDFETLCARHADLADELRRLKSLYDRGRALVRGLDAEVSSKPARTSELVFSPTERYRELGTIAVGGMGAVLEVYDAKLRRTLAMKVVRADLPQRDTRAERRRMRLLNEAQTLANLEHPSIVPIYDVGRDERGELFFTMLRVRGHDLEHVIAAAEAGRDGWTQRRLIDVLVRVCEAMAHAHRRDIVHRDLKPANVMVGPFGEVYVMDWGLARARGQQHSSGFHPPAARAEEPFKTPTLTLEGDVVGTPAYMAPEQARGDLALVGRASDVYAIGAILYRVLAGRKPYDDPDQELDAVQVLARVLAGPPASLRALAPRAPHELVAICERAMQREPEARYPNVAELLEDLRAYLDERAGRAWRDSLPRRAVKFVRRHPTATIAALAIVVLAGIIGFGSWQLHASESDRLRLQAKQNELDFIARLDRVRSRDAAERGSRGVLASAYQGDASDREYAQCIAFGEDADELARLFRESWRALDGDESVQQLGALLEAEPSERFRRALSEGLYAFVRSLGGCGAARAWRTAQGMPVVPLPSEAEQRAIAQHSGLVALWPRVVALAKLAPGRPFGSRAVEAYEALLTEGALPPLVDPAELASAQPEEIELIALVIWESDRSDPARRARAKDLFDLALLERPDAATCHMHLTRLETALGEKDMALAHAMTAAALWPEESSAHNNLGATLVHNEKIDRGMAEFRRALELEPNNSEAVVNLASHLFTQRQTEEALALLERRVAHGPDDPDAWLYLGMTLVDTVTDDSPAALTALRRAIAAFERVTELRPTDAKAWYHLGDAHCMASEPEAALVALERGLEVRPDGPDLRLGRARALAQLGRYVEAVERTLEVVRALPTASLPKEQALELYQQTQDPDDRAKIEALLSAAGLL